MQILLALLLAATFQSGEPIPVGTADRLGPLSPGLSGYPVGAVSVYGSAQPDLFAVGGGASVTAFPYGLFLYRWKGTAKDGRPIFGERIQVRQPSSDKAPRCTIWAEKTSIHGLFLDRQQLIHAVYSHSEHAFLERDRIELADLPRAPDAFVRLPNPDGTFELLFHISDGASSHPPGAKWRDSGYVPYDGAGIWRGGVPYLALYAVSRKDLSSGGVGKPRMVSKSPRDVLWGNPSLTVVDLGPGRRRHIVAGSRFGDLYYYANRAVGGIEVESRVHIVGEDGIALRHPTVNPSPIAWPNPKTGTSDLIAGGEGAFYFYRFTGRFTAEGKPVYQLPVPVLEENAPLYSGSLGVPTQVDWDGDGAVDIVCGNSEGRILFFKNSGTTAQPAFLLGVRLEAGGRAIHIQPGYKGDIQGPGEARWGYVSPNVRDWNGDGLPDIVTGDSLAQHTVYLNSGTRTNPRLAAGQPLYMDGLDMHGTWRVRPGVAKLGDRMAYVANDDNDEFHLYWRVDDYNLADGGKLRMEDGSTIGSNFLGAGGTGRSKLELCDWDGDGTTDLLVGTPRHHSVPNATAGLPRAAGLPGATVLFLKNVGSNESPRFRFPVMLRHNGRPILLGQHEIGVSAGPLGGAPGPSLLVSREDGRLILYRRDQLSGWE